MKYPTLDAYPVEPMDHEQAELLTRIIINEDKLKTLITETSFDTAGFIGKVFAQRLVACGVKVHMSAAIFALSLMERPGDAVMWTWTLFNMQHDGDHVVTINDLVYKFPSGFPTRESYDKCWDAQKVGSANGLDDQRIWVREL